MKSERRHELQVNELAVWLERTMAQVKPHVNTILAGVAVVVVLIAVGSWWSHYSRQGNAKAWDELYLGMNDPSQLDHVSERYTGTNVAAWAKLVASDDRLSQGCFLLFSNKATAIQSLRKAEEGYSDVLQNSRESRQRERALFGRARTYEALGGTQQGENNLDKAIQDYEKLVEGWPKSAYAGIAQSRLADLKSVDTKKFYDKFVGFEPKSRVSDAPGKPGKRPFFDANSLPDDVKAGDMSSLLNLDDLKKDEKKEDKKNAKKEEKKAAEPKKDAAKSEPAKKDEPKKDEPKKDAAKKDAAKKDEAKKDASKTDKP